MLEQETAYRRLTQEQLDSFTLDMNAAYARLKGVEEAIDSKTPTPSLTHTHTHTPQAWRSFRTHTGAPA